MSLYNNELLGIISLQEVLFISKKVQLSNAMLVLPIVFHKKSLSYLAHKSTKIISAQDVLLTKPELLISLNKRYYNFLPTTINCLSLCIENNIIMLNDGELLFQERLINEDAFSQAKLGKRSVKIQSAARNVAAIISDTPDNIYELCGIKL